MAQRVVLGSDAAKHVQAYIEYHNIVGNADGGKPFTEKQYEEFKQNLKKNAGNRIYTSWRNSKGLDCKMIGPASTCFCGHRYKDHNYQLAKDKKVVCKAPKCVCPLFHYIPVFGSNDFKCLCKHSFKEHDPITKRCTRGNCGGCNRGFQSTWSCSCAYKYGEHVTVFETKAERVALGKPVDDFDRMMGEFDAGTQGVSNFMSLVDGANRFEADIDKELGIAPMSGQKRLDYFNNKALQDGPPKDSLKALNE